MRPFLDGSGRSAGDGAAKSLVDAGEVVLIADLSVCRFNGMVGLGVAAGVHADKGLAMSQDGRWIAVVTEDNLVHIDLPPNVGPLSMRVLSG
jgi:hypothetical protein